MKIIGNAIQKTFLVEYRGKTYCIDYLNADYPALGLINRNNWEIIDENGEDLNTYFLKSERKAKETGNNIRLFNKLIKFCIDNFNNYNPKK